MSALSLIGKIIVNIAMLACYLAAVAFMFYALALNIIGNTQEATFYIGYSAAMFALIAGVK